MTVIAGARPEEAPVIEKLSTLDRFLPVWIGVAMALGIGLGRLFPGLDETLDRVKVDTVSLPIAVGLLLMMYPVLAKVRYSRLGEVTADRRMLGLSLALNWVIGPALMFSLAWLLLPDLPEYRTGLIIVGLARCIAMVLIWNDLACGNREAATFLVAVNSVFQILAYSLLGWFYLELLPQWIGLEQERLDVSIWEIAKSVLIFLGVPLVAGYLTRRIGEARKGAEWYEQTFLPRIGPVALYGLLFTIVVLFALQGEAITSEPLDVARIALPLLAYFALMWGSSFALGLRMGLPYDRNATVAFTAAGNNFELAIAVAIGVFGVTSGQALAGVVGPLIEVPVLVGLAYVALWARRRFYPETVA
ncbi:MAG TPA: ACR3 family arsenite efflux transporter [Acidimicrobiales bacterium]|nr:ACR3 family arsenite efflux transporter [Acidimicrobiales bacterium]